MADEKKEAGVYVCSKCGQPVAINGDKLVRSCEHKDANIIARISAQCKGKGKA